MNSHRLPSETASVVRSCPALTTTTAASAGVPSFERRAGGAQQRERLQVDAGELDPRLAERLDVALDRLAVGGDEQDLPVDGAALVDLLADDAVVDDRLVDGDRDGVVGAVEHRVGELALVVDAGDLEAADADVVRREPEPDAAARQRVQREELVQRRRERGHVADLAAGDDARREGLPGQLAQVRRAVVRRPARPRAATRRS